MSPVTVPAFIFGGAEIFILIALLLILFFGPKKIPELARSTGEATKEWKKGRKDLEGEIEETNEKKQKRESKTEST